MMKMEVKEKTGMMKIVIMAMAAVMMMAVVSCSNDEEMNAKVLTFVIAGGETRATVSEASLTDVWVFDYVGGELKQSVHQESTEDGFGTVSLTAEYGTHKLYFVASSGRVPAVNGTEITWEKCGDTFWATLELTVQPSTSSSQSVVLNRVATRLRIAVTDEVPVGLMTLRITPTKWYSGLNYLTGEAAYQNNSVHDISVPSSFAGTTGSLALGLWGISTKDAWQTDVRLQAIKSDESLMADITLANIPMRRNKITSVSGMLFGASTPLGITINTNWDETIEVTW